MEDDYKNQVDFLTNKIAELSQQLADLTESKDKSNELLCNQIFDDFINNHYDRYLDSISIEITNYDEMKDNIIFEFTIKNIEEDISSQVYINNGVFNYEMKSIYKDYLYECLNHYAKVAYKYDDVGRYYDKIEEYDVNKIFALYKALNSKLEEIDINYSFDMIIAKFTNIGYTYLPDDRINSILNNINRIRTLKAIE